MSPIIKIEKGRKLKNEWSLESETQKEKENPLIAKTFQISNRIKWSRNWLFSKAQTWRISDWWGIWRNA